MLDSSISFITSKDNPIHSSRQSKQYRRGGVVSFFLCLLACNFSTAATPFPPTPTVFELPLGSATYAPVVTVTRAEVMPTLPLRCVPDTRISPVQYDLDATVDVDTRKVSVVMRTSYQNETGQPLQQIVFNVDPGRKTGLFDLMDLQADDLDKYVLAGPRLEILLKKPLELHCRATISMIFTVQLNTIPADPALGKGYFGYSERQLNLGNWLPEIAPFMNGGSLAPTTRAPGDNTAPLLCEFVDPCK